MSTNWPFPRRCLLLLLLLATMWCSAQASAASVEHSNLIQILRAYQGQTNADLASSSQGTTTTVQPPEVSSKWIIVPGDVLELTVSDDELLSLAQARVEQDGSIHHPVMGSLPIRGMSLSEARDSIERVAAADYLVSPQVTLQFVHQANAQYTVQGKVVAPGSFPYARGIRLSLSQAIAQAGGLAINEPAQAVVERWEPGKANSSRLRINLAPQALTNAPVLPGDRIQVVPQTTGIVAPEP